MFIRYFLGNRQYIHETHTTVKIEITYMTKA